MHNSIARRRNFYKKTSHSFSENVENSYNFININWELTNTASFISHIFFIVFIVLRNGKDDVFVRHILISPEPLNLFHYFKPSLKEHFS